MRLSPRVLKDLLFFHNAPIWPSKLKIAIEKGCTVTNNFISEKEEELIFKEVEPHMKRLRYEKSHWDDAIHLYREREQRKWSTDAEVVIDRIRKLSFPAEAQHLTHVHILDLHKDGYIKPHIDSIRYCGDVVTGVSLLSDCVMRLRHKDQKDELVVDLLLSRRSLYRLGEEGRYDFTHEVLGAADSNFSGVPVERGRRISIICRDLPKQQNTVVEEEIRLRPIPETNYLMNTDGRKVSQRTTTETMEKYTKQVVENFQPATDQKNPSGDRNPAAKNQPTSSERSIPIAYVSHDTGRPLHEVLRREDDLANEVRPQPIGTQPRNMESDFPHLHRDTTELFPMCTRPSLRAVSPHTTISEHTLHLTSRKSSQNTSFTSSRKEFRSKSPSVRVKPNEDTPICHPVAPVPKPPRQYSKEYENMPLITRDSSTRTSRISGVSYGNRNPTTFKDCHPFDRNPSPNPRGSRILVSECEVTVTKRCNDINWEPLGAFVNIPREARPVYPDYQEIPYADCDVAPCELPVKKEPQFCQEMRDIVEIPVDDCGKSKTPSRPASRNSDVWKRPGEPQLGSYVHIPRNTSPEPRIDDYCNQRPFEAKPLCDPYEKEVAPPPTCNETRSERHYPEKVSRNLETYSLRSQSCKSEKLHYEYQHMPGYGRSTNPCETNPYHRNKSPFMEPIQRTQTPPNLDYCTRQSSIEYPPEIIDPRHHPIKEYCRNPVETRPPSRSTVRSVPIIVFDSDESRRNPTGPTQPREQYPTREDPRIQSRGRNPNEHERPYTPTTVHTLYHQEEYTGKRSITPQPRAPVVRDIPIGYQKPRPEHRKQESPEGIVYPRDTCRPSSVSRCDCGRVYPPVHHEYIPQSNSSYNPRKEPKKAPRSASVHPNADSPRFRDETIVKETFERTTTTRTLNQSTFV